jgi:hypothetical protein
MTISPTGTSIAADAKVEGHPPLASAAIPEAQNHHGQRLEDEAPDDAKA